MLRDVSLSELNPTAFAEAMALRQHERIKKGAIMKRIGRNNKIYGALLSYSLRQQIMLTAGIILILLAIWFFFLYQPMKSRIQSCQKRLAENTTVASQCDNLHAQCAQLEQKNNGAEEQLQKYNDKSKARDYLSTIAKLGHQATVCIEQCSLEQTEDKDNMRILPISVTGHGTMAQIKEFLSKVSATYSTAAPAQINAEHIKDNVFQFNIRLAFYNIK